MTFGSVAAADAARLPPLSRSALLLDLDGTLLDIAATPDAVVVPDELPVALRQLKEACGGALAIVTGRPVDQVDALLPGLITAVAGEHGAALRSAPGAELSRLALPDLPDAWSVQAAALVAPYPGALVEMKRRGLVLHYRLAPQAGPALQAGLLAMLAPWQEQFQLQQALMAWEIRPRGVDKGGAVTNLMQGAPFAGRLPVFIGDDVTDHDGIRAAQKLGGAGLLVADWFGDAGGVRAWLARSAAALEWAPLEKTA